ncbi:hypothetical protein TEA_006852 [Camellia sinensis var. sinensis]|uniref:RBR-type E3 ubiquitin transferase n=1 Tax=Camellia sinensis var. sinensis TaxID=542762 RepID=A0A4S4EME2_CAMSN|nr:hypothetical protein TEA_006852 [Camellia sinensis var. sinensis]
MEKQTNFGCGSVVNSGRETKLEEDEEDFRSCCEDEDELMEREESAKESSKDILDEGSVNMFFKGISIANAGECGTGLSGIGVVMERSANVALIQVQKKLDFYVDESVANYLALMDGLLEAARNKIVRVFACTDSEILYDQIINGEKLDNPLLLALRQRILEHAEDLEAFVLKSFLPVASYEMLERALAESNVINSDKIYCPFPNCSVLLDPHECLSTRASSSSQSDNSCVECPVCHRFICVECGVPWHSSMSCEEYQNLPLDERDAADITLHRLAESNRWRRCQQCRRMIELIHGCYHMTCWCGHEFCYSCGAGYRDGQQTCQCAFWDEDNSEDLVAHPTQESEQWAWDSFDSLPMIMDAYTDQERSQLALIQRFLAGGFSLSDHHPYQSPPRCTDSYVDAMKDLHQLPWLERFVSVISDNYYDEYIQ